MFAYLIGKIADVSEDNLVLEVNRIGFNIKIPSSLLSALPGLGEEVKIHTYTCVREDSFQLFPRLGLGLTLLDMVCWIGTYIWGFLS